jgi:predicted DCC family thiol-disulfide oxidoreductase YuxK
MRLLQGQIAALYLSAFRYKTLGASWMDGSALHYVLHTQHVFARNWTLLIADNAPLMALGTYSALVFEGIFPVMVFAPVARGQLKAAALLGGIALHLGIAATINVGHFSYLMPLTYLCLLEPAWVQRGVDGLQRLCVATPVRVVYDGERPLHQQAAAWLGAMDLYHRLEWVDTRSAPLPVTEPALRPEEVRARLHVIEPGGRVTRGFDALAVAFQRLPATFALAPFLRLPVLRPVGRALFDGWVARRLEGFTVQSRPAPLGERTLRWVNGLKHAAGATLFTAVVLHGYPGAYAIPRFGEDTLQLFSLWHGWDTFAPDPIQTDAHLRAVGTFSDGHQEDLFGGPVDGPGEVRGFLFSRWWKYFETVTRGAETYRREWGRWQCRTHREPGEPRLEQVVFIQERQLIPPIGQPWPKQKLGVWKHRCYKPRGGPASDPAAVPAAGPAGEEADADAGPPSPTLEQP